MTSFTGFCSQYNVLSIMLVASTLRWIMMIQRASICRIQIMNLIYTTNQYNFEKNYFSKNCNPATAGLCTIRCWLSKNKYSHIVSLHTQMIAFTEWTLRRQLANGQCTVTNVSSHAVYKYTEWLPPDDAYSHQKLSDCAQNISGWFIHALLVWVNIYGSQ